MPRTATNTDAQTAPRTGKAAGAARKTRQAPVCEQGAGTAGTATAISPSLFALRLPNIPGIRAYMQQEQGNVTGTKGNYSGMFADLWKCYCRAKWLLTGETLTLDPQAYGLQLEPFFLHMLEQVRGWVPEGVGMNIEHDPKTGYYFMLYYKCEWDKCGCTITAKPLYDTVQGNEPLERVLTDFLATWVKGTGMSSWWGELYMTVEQMEEEREDMKGEDVGERDEDWEERYENINEAINAYRSGLPHKMGNLLLATQPVEPWYILERLSGTTAKNKAQELVVELITYGSEWMQQHPGNIVNYSRYREDEWDMDELEHDMYYTWAWDYDLVLERYGDSVDDKANNVGIYDPIARLELRADTEAIDLKAWENSWGWPKQYNDANGKLQGMCDKITEQ